VVSEEPLGAGSGGSDHEGAFMTRRDEASWAGRDRLPPDIRPNAIGVAVATAFVVSAGSPEMRHR
jgi:hypothetical protein